jgi:hypothetical protein
MRLDKVIHSIQTTHTFGGVKSWSKGLCFPYVNILFVQKSIYSQRFRIENDLIEKDEPIRVMSQAKHHNLDNFVFAYLGNHEHYYSKCEGFNSPPFGVFISTDLDSKQTTNALEYDLASPLAKNSANLATFLSPYIARNQTIEKIRSEFSDNFFHYWVCPDYISKGYNDVNSWTWKTEFHYHEKVSTQDITAILWPVVMVAQPSSKTQRVTIWEPDERYERHRIAFENDKANKNIKVYPYLWEAITSAERFSYASFIVAEYFFNNLVLPSEIDFNKMFYSKFKDID